MSQIDNITQQVKRLWNLMESRKELRPSHHAADETEYQARLDEILYELNLVSEARLASVPTSQSAELAGAGSVPADFTLLREIVGIERRQQVADQLEAAYQRAPDGMPVEITEALVWDILGYLRSCP